MDNIESVVCAFLAERYKFFISFENGDCDDYITEKYFRYAKAV